MRKLGLALVAMMLAAPAVAAPPIAAYGQLPGMSDVRISPDGKRFAAVVGNAEKAEIQIRDAANGALVSASATQKDKIRDLFWAGPEHLIAVLSTTAGMYGVSGRHEWFAINDFNVATKKWKPLLANIDNALNVIGGAAVALTVAGRPVLVVQGLYAPGSRVLSTLFRIQLDSGRAAIQEVGTAETADWVLGDDGKAVARAEYSQETGEWRLFTKSDSGWKRGHVEVARIDRPGLISLGRSPGTLLLTTRRSGDWQVHEVALGDGTLGAPLPDTDLDSIILDPANRRMIGTNATSLETTTYAFIAAADQRLWRSIGNAFPGEQVLLASWSDDRTRIIVEVDGPTSGDAFFLIDRTTKTAQKIGDRYPAIGPGDIAPVRAFHYAAADGLDIPAYLTLPRGRPAKGLPLVVLAHGGPAARDMPGFDWWAQALASRGYAVLQPQFRGSADFGPKHLEAGYGQWGRKMQTDLSDGVRRLAGEGTIDPARVCIVGASYGGYAALAGVTLDPGVYRCASAVAGVADLRRMLTTQANDSGSRSSTMRYWRRFMGVGPGDDARLDAVSPMRLAARVKVPVQLIHGKDDTVVRFEQSVIMEQALRTAGASVELVTLAGEDHWLSRGPTRVQMLTAMIGFLEKHNPPVVATSASPPAPGVITAGR